jgi:hypothetical protein
VLTLTHFAASAPKYVSAMPEGDELWAANVVAVRRGLFCDIFEDVLFIESDRLSEEARRIVIIYGIETPDGRPEGLTPYWAEKQQKFVHFLRDQTRADNKSMGPLSKLFEGSEYRNEEMATAAYVSSKKTRLLVGIGYTASYGQYTRVTLDPEDSEYMEKLQFDELVMLGRESLKEAGNYDEKQQHEY